MRKLRHALTLALAMLAPPLLAAELTTAKMYISHPDDENITNLAFSSTGTPGETYAIQIDATGASYCELPIDNTILVSYEMTEGYRPDVIFMDESGEQLDVTTRESDNGFYFVVPEVESFHFDFRATNTPEGYPFYIYSYQGASSLVSVTNVNEKEQTLEVSKEYEFFSKTGNDGIVYIPKEEADGTFAIKVVPNPGYVLSIEDCGAYYVTLDNGSTYNDPEGNEYILITSVNDLFETGYTENINISFNLKHERQVHHCDINLKVDDKVFWSQNMNYNGECTYTDPEGNVVTAKTEYNWESSELVVYDSSYVTISLRVGEYDVKSAYLADEDGNKVKDLELTEVTKDGYSYDMPVENVWYEFSYETFSETDYIIVEVDYKKIEITTDNTVEIYYATYEDEQVVKTRILNGDSVEYGRENYTLIARLLPADEFHTLNDSIFVTYTNAVSGLYEESDEFEDQFTFDDDNKPYQVGDTAFFRIYLYSGYKTINIRAKLTANEYTLYSNLDTPVPTIINTESQDTINVEIDERGSYWTTQIPYGTELSISPTENFTGYKYTDYVPTVVPSDTTKNKPYDLELNADGTYHLTMPGEFTALTWKSTLKELPFSVADDIKGGEILLYEVNDSTNAHKAKTFHYNDMLRFSLLPDDGYELSSLAKKLTFKGVNDNGYEETFELPIDNERMRTESFLGMLYNIDVLKGDARYFTEKLFTATYMIGDSVFKELTVYYNDSVPNIEGPVVPGYVFKGWDKPDIMPAKDIVVTGEMEFDFSLSADNESATFLLEDWAKLADAINAEALPAENKVVLLNGDMEYEKPDLNLEDLTIDQAALNDAIEKIETITGFDGSIDGAGATVSNMAYLGGNIIDQIAQGASFSNISFENVTAIMNGLLDNFYISNDTVFVSVLAKSNAGTISALSYVGKILLDNEKMLNDIFKGYTVVTCLVGENLPGASVNAFFFNEDVPDDTEGNKQCISIKQNLGIGRNMGNAKVATNGSGSNKAFSQTVDFSAPRFQKQEVVFSNEEFKSGIVAAWLNYAGKGFSGNFTGEWAQGLKYPVRATVLDGVSNAVYRIAYQTNDSTAILDAPDFQSGGKTIAISTKSKPEEIELKGATLVSSSDTETVISIDGTGEPEVSLKFAMTALQNVAADADFAINGNTISVSRGTATVYTLAGVEVATVSNGKATIAKPGLYVVKTGNNSTTVLIK